MRPFTLSKQAKKIDAIDGTKMPPITSPSTGQLPTVDLTVGLGHALPPEVQATLNPIQRKMRSGLGIVIFLLVSFGIGVVPITAIPPVLYFLQWTGLGPHWAIRRFFDCCVAYWMSVITVYTI